MTTRIKNILDNEIESLFSEIYKEVNKLRDLNFSNKDDYQLMEAEIDNVLYKLECLKNKTKEQKYSNLNFNPNLKFRLESKNSKIYPKE